MKVNKMDVVGLVNVYVIVPLLFLNGSIILLGKASRFPYFGVLILFTFFSIAVLHISNFILIFQQVHQHDVFKKGLGIVCFIVAFFILFMQFGIVKKNNHTSNSTEMK
uniref:Uncharacterized protein n=1 Tax=viral metagenome TaxID=1070528 RepID=A0A6C0D0K6_9ZZZZ